MFSISSVRVASASVVRRSGYPQQKRSAAHWRQGNRCIFVSFVLGILQRVRPSGLGLCFQLHLTLAAPDTGATRGSPRIGAKAIGAFMVFVSVVFRIVTPRGYEELRGVLKISELYFKCTIINYVTVHLASRRNPDEWFTS